MKLKAGIIGLGNIGSLFDEDPKRKAVWSHAGAYLASHKVEIIAGADTDSNRLDKFSRRCPHAGLYQDYREMLSDNRLDIVSICTPTASHFKIFSRATSSDIKAVFCEKPIAARVEDARRMVAASRTKNIILAVNHTRRWDPRYLRVKEYIDQGRIGEVRSITGNYSDKVFMVGTHLVDTIRLYGGDIDWVVGEGSNLDSDDPGISGLLSFKNGARGFIIDNGKRENLIFEIDVLGAQGRVRIIDNGYHTEFLHFEKSDRFSGYRELKRQPLKKLKTGKSPLAAAIGNIIECIEKGGEPACTGEDGLKALETTAALCKSARNNNQKIRLR